jgi:cytochrome c biogenesis protein CcdA
MGVVVALFELGCTGQIYFPTLTYIIRIEKESRGYAYLALYNVGFIASLVAVFVLSYFGVRSQRLSAVFRRNMAGVKLATALLFFGLAALSVLTR